MHIHILPFLICTLLFLGPDPTCARIDRRALVSRYNPVRTASSPSTPMQVGNGHFAFGADVTGLQTFLPFAIMSDWGWKNDSFPPGRTQADIDQYRGEVWNGVEYAFGGPPDLENWLEANPNRINLGRVGLLFRDEQGNVMNVTEDALDTGRTRQELDLWTGTITSTFHWEGAEIRVRTTVAESSDAVGIVITSPLLQRGRLGLFLDFPWHDGSAGFEAPFVGAWNAMDKHTTALDMSSSRGSNVDATITHKMVNTTVLTFIGGGDNFTISRLSPDAHQYAIVPEGSGKSFRLSVAYSPRPILVLPSATEIENQSREVWQDYWSENGFVDVATGSTDLRADELQRRIILSQYLLRVNEAGDTPPQEVSQVYLYHVPQNATEPRA